MKRIALSLATIAAVITMTVAATGAYFSDTQSVNGTFATGTVSLDDSWLTPISITGLYPGAESTANFNVNYIGSVKGDIYFSFQHASGGAVLGDELSFRVEKTDGNGTSLGYVTGWLTADQPYTQWIKLASGVSQNTPAYYTVHVYMRETGLNTELQGLTAKADIVIYAVQQGGLTPSLPM
jgi:predicted ribosomally synthesized peptide with SipW-like signal peptide